MILGPQLILAFTALTALFPAAASAQTGVIVDCTKPLTVPDRWDDQDGDAQHDPGEAYDPYVTGYEAPGDVGRALVLRPASPPGPVIVGTYYAVSLPALGDPEAPPLTGNNWFRTWMTECGPFVGLEDSLQLEPGQMIQATMEAVQEIIDMDPQATWDEGVGAVINSAYGRSPRLLRVPFYDPRYLPVSGRNYVYVAKIVILFVESLDSGAQINTRIVEVNPADLPSPVQPSTWGRIKVLYRR